MTRLEIIKNYAIECIAHPETNCKKHRWACERFLRDLKRIGSEDFPYVWDESSAESIVRWFTYLRHKKGILARQPINLTEWQQFRLCQLYGWRHKETGNRRFKKYFVEVGRKNARHLASVVETRRRMTEQNRWRSAKADDTEPTSGSKEPLAV